MIIRRKHLGRFALVVVALFIVAAPLGDNHNGIGKTHPVVATIGQGVFLTFLLAALLLVVATAVALVQLAVNRTRATS